MEVYSELNLVMHLSEPQLYCFSPDLELVSLKQCIPPAQHRIAAKEPDILPETKTRVKQSDYLTVNG